VKTGAVMASISTIRCEVTGREGHGAEPHLAGDAVTAAASLVLGWQVALSRRVDPRQPVVLSIGRLSSGVTPNVIPGRAEIEGTLRSLDPTIEDDLRRILSDVARGVEAQTGTSISLSSDLVVPAVVNDPVVTAMVARATVETLGEEAMVEATPTLGGDDFAWFLQRVPGCYLFVGEQQQGRGQYGWHDPSYDLDEDALVYGSAVLAAAALQAVQGRGQWPDGGSGETNSPTRGAST
jgi:amidohydrolase